MKCIKLFDEWTDIIGRIEWQNRTSTREDVSTTVRSLAMSSGCLIAAFIGNYSVNHCVCYCLQNVQKKKSTAALRMLKDTKEQPPSHPKPLQKNKGVLEEE